MIGDELEYLKRLFLLRVDQENNLAEIRGLPEELSGLGRVLRELREESGDPARPGVLARRDQALRGGLRLGEDRRL